MECLVIDAKFSVEFVHRLRFTRDAFSPSDTTLIDAIGEGGNLPAKAMVFVDAGLVDVRPGLLGEVEAYCEAHKNVIHLSGPIQTVIGGEDSKNNPRGLLPTLHAIDEAAPCRQSYIIAIGGGAVLDTIGFAAAIAHRGIRLIRFPTTTLAQGDSGVGVKNGVNAFGKKNYLGTFAVPWAVINDEIFLTSLSDRDWRSGFIEAVKVALIKDAAFFDQIEANADAIRYRNMAKAMPIIKKSAEVHLQHITEFGDPFEMTTARPLDFGHWAAHKLEQMTRFRLRHGEAVAIGVALDAVYSARIGLLDWASVHRIHRVITNLGFKLYDPALQDTDMLVNGIQEFREHLGGQLTIAMLKGIGQLHDVHEMHEDHVLASIDYLASIATSNARRTADN